MPLTHVQNSRRRGTSEPVPEPVATSDEPEAGFEGVFAPPPVPVATTTAPVTDRPAEPMRAAPANVPLGAPTPFVRILHNQVGAYARGSIVPAAAFENLQRLLELEAVAYDRDATVETVPDPAFTTAMSLAAPANATPNLPRAPWAQASVADILGPAGTRYATRLEGTYSYQPAPVVQAEHGQTLHIAQPSSTTEPVATGAVVTDQEMQLGPEGQHPRTNTEPVQYR